MEKKNCWKVNEETNVDWLQWYRYRHSCRQCTVNFYFFNRYKTATFNSVSSSCAKRNWSTSKVYRRHGSWGNWRAFPYVWGFLIESFHIFFNFYSKKKYIFCFWKIFNVIAVILQFCFLFVFDFGPIDGLSHLSDNGLIQ